MGLQAAPLPAKSAKPGLDLAHTVPSVASSTLPGILGCYRGLAWRSGDLGHVPPLLVICNVTLGILALPPLLLHV